jgi:hypothetical protein
MLQRMVAEILFLDPADRDPCIAVLKELGFEVELLDWTDDYGPTVWIEAQINTDVSADRFLDWVSNIVEPLRGDCVEAGLADPEQAAAWSKSWHSSHGA